jgi:hypothetical protein
VSEHPAAYLTSGVLYRVEQTKYGFKFVPAWPPEWWWHEKHGLRPSPESSTGRCPPGCPTCAYEYLDPEKRERDEALVSPPDREDAP